MSVNDTSTIILERRAASVRAAVAVDAEDVVVFRGGEELPWSIGTVHP
jgi:dihydroorotase